MKVCILGNGLISLTLAKSLINQGIYVDIFSSNNNFKYKKTQTIGISKSNVDFFNKNILNIKNLLWDINKIEIYSESLNNEKILNFNKQNEKLFSIIKNYELYSLLLTSLKKSHKCNFKKILNPKNLLKKDYKLIINTDFFSPYTKKFFHRRIKKDYKSLAYTSIIRHRKLNNNIASQIFTANGPLAFLPISNTETSIVYSYNGRDELNFKKLVNRFNKFYKILSYQKVSSFELQLVNLRSYHYKNILAFGDLLHKIHPLAGQGFNMSLRDINEILRLISLKKKNGLDLDNSICKEFENSMKHKNFIFSNCVDFIYEYFNFENKIKNNTLSKTVRYLGKNYTINRYFTKIADSGLII